jgi:hypothetical protein
MRTFETQSTRLGCEIRLHYNNNGVLSGFLALTEESKSPEELIAFINFVPLTVEDLYKVSKHNKIPLVEILPDLSFQAFWDSYNYKDGGSKKRANGLWEKISAKDRALAIGYLPKYDKFLAKKNIEKAYASTYLNNRYWEN